MNINLQDLNIQEDGRNQQENLLQNNLQEDYKRQKKKIRCTIRWFGLTLILRIMFIFFIAGFLTYKVETLQKRQYFDDPNLRYVPAYSIIARILSGLCLLFEVWYVLKIIYLTCFINRMMFDGDYIAFDKCFLSAFVAYICIGVIASSVEIYENRLKKRSSFDQKQKSRIVILWFICYLLILFTDSCILYSRRKILDKIDEIENMQQEEV